MNRSLVPKLSLVTGTALLALTFTAVVLPNDAVAKFYGSKPSNYGDGKRATRGLEKFSGSSECIVDRDGSLLASKGLPSGVRLTKLNVKGRPSSRFGRSGRVRIDGVFKAAEPRFDAAHRVLIAGSRKINGVKRLGILRLTSKGRPDGSFGNNGFAEIPSPGKTSAERTLVKPLADGRIAVATSTTDGWELDRLIVLSASGQPDPGFAEGGSLKAAVNITDVSDAGAARLLVMGTFRSNANVNAARATMYFANGIVDTSWGDLGAVTWTTLPTSVYRAIEKGFLSTQEPNPGKLDLSTPNFYDARATLTTSGAIVLALVSYTESLDPNFEMDGTYVWTTRLNPGGRLDTSFWNGGARYGSGVNNESSWMDEGDSERVEWELLPEGRLANWWALYGYTDEVSGDIETLQKGKKDRGFELKYLVARDVAFDPARNRALLCATVAKQMTVFSLPLK